MDNIHDLLNTLKTISQGVGKSEQPMSVDYAEVKATSPLKLDFGEFQVSESDELLVVSDRVKMLAKGKITLRMADCVTGAQVEKECTFVDPKPLKSGDCVVCVQEPGAEGWVVLDRVEVDE